MRDLFRLLAIALASFTIVGVAMVYSRGGDLKATIGTLADSVGSTVDNLGNALAGPATAETAPAPATYSLAVARPKAATWMGLAGFPDQAEIVFPIPRGHTYKAGAFDLVFDTALTEHGDGLMTLSVNGTPRTQLVLDAGRSTQQVRIDLTPADLAGDSVVLHMAGRGTTNSGQICPTDAANSGSAITLTAASRLELTSDQPQADVAGGLSAVTQVLALKPGPNSGDLALAIWADQQFGRAGIASRLGEAGTGETAVEITGHAIGTAGLDTGNVLIGEPSVSAVIDDHGAATETPTAWPVQVADLGAETIVKSFRGSRRWTIPFAAADLPGGALPESFALRLKATPLAAGNDWVVRVALNGNLVDTRRLGGDTDTIAYDVALPAERLLPANMLTVELVDTTPSQSLCARGPDAQAQLLPESSLTDAAPATLSWASLIERLATATDVTIATSDSVNLVQAQRARDMMAAVLPRDARVRFDAGGAMSLRVVNKADLALALGASTATTQAILPAANPSTAPLVVPAPGAELSAALERLGPDDVVILATRR